jgi:PhzF family phenazine biosynthesis protein
MSIRITQVDAFTAKPFSGNPAAVCILDSAAPDEWMQNVALEMNLAETAFLFREGDGYRLRWFTPVAEVALCGHATVATAHVLWEDGHLPKSETARFHTLSGLLTAEREDGWIKLDFPAKVPTACDAPDGLFEALGINAAQYVGRNAFDYLVELAYEDEVRSLQPNMTALARVDARGTIVTARSNGEFDFISRFFAPAVGVPEDPVTGSAHCALAPYWAEKLEKNDMMAYQASPRGGVVKLGLRGDRVWLYGHAVTVLTGELHLSPEHRA